MMESNEIVAAEAIIDNGRFGKRVVRFETGRLAKQAAGSAMAYLDDETAILSATTVGKQPKDQFDFFPLTVDVEERSYAAGRIPGSFFRREGRPGTEAILAARLIDRPLRPGFVKGLRNEVQVHETVLAVHPDDAYDVLAINAASMSTQIAGLPFTGPIGGTRLALIDDQWVAFPRWSEMERSVFNIVVAGRIVTAEDGSDDVAIMMVEAGGGDNEWDLIQAGAMAPTEDVVADGLEAAKPFIRVLCEAQIEVAQRASKETAEFPLFFDYTDEEYAAVEEWVGDKLAAALLTEGKLARDEAVEAVKSDMLAALEERFPEAEKDLKAAFRSLEKSTIRNRTLREEIRMDGRTPRQIRSLAAEVEVLPRVHGSALFQRGETQILGVTTLAMLRMEQQLDNLSPITAKRYMHQYNFPPFSTGETGRVGSPKRREIGHGDLAERALRPVIPSREDFPYAIRQVSEALGSNGSTSMGSVCASTLSMLQAGVPLRAPVAGIAMGLMTGEVDGVQKAVTLTDILGAEDGFGDMDFKVAGTRQFITALQLDTKLDGIDSQVLRAALAQARDARIAILDFMEQAIDSPDEMSPHAPRIITVQIPVDKIGEVIGPKGKMINQIQEDTGADLTIEDDGTVYIGASTGEAAEAARAVVNQIANPQMPEVGERFVGTVVKTTSFGAFISLTPGKDGLLHISQVRRLVGGKRIESVDDVLQVGQQVEVEIAEIGDRGKLSLHAVVEGEVAAEEVSADTESETSARPARRERRDRTDRRERRPRTRTRRRREDEDGGNSADESVQE
ncbi:MULTISPECIES: polyribonucleotide nucleotidyltransferase [unclassified Schaalia]|uniref:polyribonucleotide nucleotidyltransferase n=1 Tax=unclassified Schaalia TaxID=2691889 RepID=UPI001E6170AA|nr:MULTISPECIES: polyribonucleotide nucleotidyltransferase [unclassified Schaalia]MCD4549386.1 polyribonucleotide nucleotidyltransferase [Schaalia sp. lx-260]MCD4557946.1 polyribonucleotide nucleotidyltransferase [Schaalia sp. lx-100]